MIDAVLVVEAADYCAVELVHFVVAALADAAALVVANYAAVAFRHYYFVAVLANFVDVVECLAQYVVEENFAVDLPLALHV